MQNCDLQQPSEIISGGFFFLNINYIFNWKAVKQTVPLKLLSAYQLWLMQILRE